MGYQRSPLSNQERFWAKVLRGESDECWPWQGGHSDRGYGRFTCRAEGDEPERITGAHRLAYEWSIGPIPEGFTIDHLCENPPCCNPAHLEPVSHGDNTRRWHAAHNPTHCPKGHEFTPENTVRKASHPGRMCLTCNRDWAREHQREYRESGRAAIARARWTPEQWARHRARDAEAHRRRRLEAAQDR